MPVVRDNTIEITRPTGAKHVRDRSSGSLTYHVQDLEHRVSEAVAAIEHMVEAGPSKQFLQGQDMRPSQVAHMDIVPDTGSVRGSEIVTVNCQFRSLAEHQLHT